MDYSERIHNRLAGLRTDNSARAACTDIAAEADAEIAALRKDAERYRWLRAQAGQVIDWDSLQSVEHDGLPLCELLDATADAALPPGRDDGSALRVVETLRMTVAHEPNRGGWSAGCVVGGEFKWLAHDDDCKRAIVRAAAAVGAA